MPTTPPNKLLALPLRLIVFLALALLAVWSIAAIDRWAMQAQHAAQSHLSGPAAPSR